MKENHGSFFSLYMSTQLLALVYTSTVVLTLQLPILNVAVNMHSCYPNCAHLKLASCCQRSSLKILLTVYSFKNIQNDIHQIYLYIKIQLTSVGFARTCPNEEPKNKSRNAVHCWVSVSCIGVVHTTLCNTFAWQTPSIWPLIENVCTVLSRGWCRIKSVLQSFMCQSLFWVHR